MRWVEILLDGREERWEVKRERGEEEEEMVVERLVRRWRVEGSREVEGR